MVDPNNESKTNASDEHKESGHALRDPPLLSNSSPPPVIKLVESSTLSGNHSRHSSKDDTLNAISVSTICKSYIHIITLLDCAVQHQY